MLFPRPIWYSSTYGLGFGGSSFGIAYAVLDFSPPHLAHFQVDFSHCDSGSEDTVQLKFFFALY